MDEQRQRIVEDLGGELAGELFCDDFTTTLYASDASLYQVPPLAVVCPRDRDDVVAAVRYAAEEGLGIIPRGAGSGLVGGCLGRGIVIDFSRHMHRVLAIGSETVTVEPGVVRDELNRQLRPLGRYFPPDPSGSPVTTIGGMLAVDAAGSRSVRVGSTRDHVERLELVLADGSVITAGSEPLDARGIDPVDPHQRLCDGLARTLRENAELIEERQPPLMRNCSGYYLRGVLTENRLELARMLVGSEGTLGLFTAATLFTAPLPEHRGIVLLLFGGLEDAINTVQAIADLQPSACDLMDRRVLSLGREADPRFAAMIPAGAEAGLIVEQAGYARGETTDRIARVISAARSVAQSTWVAHEAYEYDEVEFVWSLPQRIVPLLTRLKGTTRPLPFVEDIAVPPELLHEFLGEAQRVFQKHEVTASLYAHAAAGQVHLRPFLPAPTPEAGPAIENLARDLYEVVFRVGGTISGEHGDGLARTAFLRSQYGPLYRVFQFVKDLFDPQRLLNPGKIISDDPHLTIRDFRPTVAPAAEPPEGLVSLELSWDRAELATAATDCNGCGACRTQAPGQRMCPFFRIDSSELASPRAKANAMRRLLGPQGDSLIDSTTLEELAGLCFNCKQCQLECPGHVNVPQMMVEAKAARVADAGLGRSDWFAARAHALSGIASLLPQAANWLLGNPTSRWVLERLLGLDRRRKLPLLARRPFLRSLKRRWTTKPQPGTRPRPVVYFVDHFANYHDPELAQALVAVLEHNGIPVHVPPDQQPSGMGLISAGDLAAARELAERNLRALGELAREGYTILCTEPSAAVCLSQEYPMLLDHPDGPAVAEAVVEAGTFLARLQAAGELDEDFSAVEVNAGYHAPCHLKALGDEPGFTELLSLIPGLRLSTIEVGCSGMAGAWGMTRENFATSLQIGQPLISRMQDGDLGLGTTECSSCRIQMEQGTRTTRTVHPLKLLALSYGLLPRLASRLTRPGRPLVIS